MKKKLIALLTVLGVVIILGLIFWSRNKNKQNNQENNNFQPNQEVEIKTPLQERPYVFLTPSIDGREFTLDIERIKDEIKTIEYELVYDSQGLPRGVIGSIDLKDNEHQVQRKLTLGTCSKNVCKYDEGVEKGTLTLRLRSSLGVEKFTSDFHLQKGSKELTSADGKFKLEGKFPANAFYLVMPTIGLPEKIEGKFLSEPYGVFTAEKSGVKNLNLTLSLLETTETAKLFLFDGKSLTESSGAKVEGDKLNATVNSLGIFFATE